MEKLRMKNNLELVSVMSDICPMLIVKNGIAFKPSGNKLKALKRYEYEKLKEANNGHRLRDGIYSIIDKSKCGVRSFHDLGIDIIYNKENDDVYFDMDIHTGKEFLENWDGLLIEKYPNEIQRRYRYNIFETIKWEDVCSRSF